MSRFGCFDRNILERTLMTILPDITPLNENNSCGTGKSINKTFAENYLCAGPYA